MTASFPSRRVVLQSIAGVILGVFAYSKLPRWPGFFGGYIEARPLESLIDREERDDPPLPTEFVTPADDDRLDGLSPLQDVLQRSSEQAFRRELSRGEFGDMYRVLEKLPVFEPDYEENDHPAVSRGIYVRDEEYTYNIQLVPWCSDVWWIETRGTPEGWPRCHQR